MKLDYGSNVEAIKSALKAASERVKQLEAENQRLKQQLQKLSTFSKKQRQRIKSQAGALRSAQTKVKKLRVSLKRAKSAARRTIRRVTPTPKPAPIIKSVTRRTREQYLEQMKPQFIERFIRRLHGAYPDFKAEWDADVRRVLMSFTVKQIDDKMEDTLNMMSMYYESSSYSINRGATGRSVYESLVQYLPDLESE